MTAKRHPLGIIICCTLPLLWVSRSNYAWCLNKEWQFYKDCNFCGQSVETQPCVFLELFCPRLYILMFYYPRDAMLARVIAIATCPSVRLSVTRQYCVKTKKASFMISSPSGSTKTLVFGLQISSPNSMGFPPNGGLKQGSVGKIQRFSSFKRQYFENGIRYGQSYY